MWIRNPREVRQIINLGDPFIIDSVTGFSNRTIVIDGQSFF